MPLLLRSEEHTSELQSPCNLVCRLLLEKKKKKVSIFSLVSSGQEPVPGTSRVCRMCQLKCCLVTSTLFFFFFFNDTATTEIYTLSLHDALPICCGCDSLACGQARTNWSSCSDRKSTRLNSSHLVISYAVFCLKKKKKQVINKLEMLSYLRVAVYTYRS